MGSSGRGKEEGSGDEVNDDAANGGLKVKEQSEVEEDLALGSHKTEPKVTPFKLKIPPKVEVASGSEIESSSELSAMLVVKKKKKSKKSKKKERREYREGEEELVAKDRKPPKRKIKEEVDNFKIESTEEPVDPSSCVVVESDLCQGLRVLCKIDSHFHPARVEEVSPPDIYGVRVIKDRA